MTLRHLKIFIAVVDAGSMTLASTELHISQPTVSQAISELEQHYGVKLFDRLSKRLFITEIGKQLLSYARHITDLFEQMDQAARDPDASGVIKVGASMTVGAYLLPKIINRFAESYPAIQMQAVIKNTSDIGQLLVKNMIDFAVVEGTIHVAELIVTPFMDDELVMVCGKTHPFYRREHTTLKDLSGVGFVVRERGSGTRELFENVMASKDTDWHLLWECDGSDGLKSAAMNGIGIAVISQKLVEKELASGDLYALRVKAFDLKRKFSVVYHKNKFLTPAMKSFFNLCDTFVLIKE